MARVAKRLDDLPTIDRRLQPLERQALPRPLRADQHGQVTECDVGVGDLGEVLNPQAVVFHLGFPWLERRRLCRSPVPRATLAGLARPRGIRRAQSRLRCTALMPTGQRHQLLSQRHVRAEETAIVDSRPLVPENNSPTLSAASREVETDSPTVSAAAHERETRSPNPCFETRERETRTPNPCFETCERETHVRR